MLGKAHDVVKRHGYSGACNEPAGERSEHLVAAVVYDKQFCNGVPVVARGQHGGETPVVGFQMPRYHGIAFGSDVHPVELDERIPVVNDILRAAHARVVAKAAAEVKAERFAV
ncbi:hypothetical protein SDC9_75904 [bioreactor metagenome]|uniref:Uncharacterized protein n=1 Tax=bioreactor metagenome TaxID=1076179 RepID=A0A644YTI6_9ZZZZ